MTESGLEKKTYKVKDALFRFVFVFLSAGFAPRCKAAEEKSGGAGGREGPVWEETKRHQGTLKWHVAHNPHISMVKPAWTDDTYIHVCR